MGINTNIDSRIIPIPNEQIHRRLLRQQPAPKIPKFPPFLNILKRGLQETDGPINVHKNKITANKILHIPQHPHSLLIHNPICKIIKITAITQEEPEYDHI